jgi:hypothetical protein
MDADFLIQGPILSPIIYERCSFLEVDPPLVVQDGLIDVDEYHLSEEQTMTAQRNLLSDDTLDVYRALSNEGRFDLFSWFERKSALSELVNILP